MVVVVVSVPSLPTVPYLSGSTIISSLPAAHSEGFSFAQKNTEQRGTIHLMIYLGFKPVLKGQPW